eukprot:TRINITY_DN11488_c0_g2_i1.p1 TRINITY_DN11488_c0_g2~~TRINITY_DN11488_c0_g2_i1.p1  ORF type:complete len:348 (-),score=59.36 TRINITY_DN11488_c0_g2_i1:246-1289(-)
MAKAQVSKKHSLTPGIDGTGHRHLHDWTQQRSTRHGMSVPQLHQRIDDLSEYIRGIREEMVSFVKTEIGDALKTKVFAVESAVSRVDERLHRMEMLLLRSDLETFQAIDRAVQSCKQSFPGEVASLESEHLEMVRPDLETAPSAAQNSEVSGWGYTKRPCGHKDVCLCGLWASSDGCVVKVRHQKCDFICQGAEDLCDGSRSDAGSSEDDAESDLRTNEDGTFFLLSWQAVSVMPDKVDWVRVGGDETTTWHRLSLLVDWTAEEMIDDGSEPSLGDVVQVTESLRSVDTQLGVEIPAGCGGHVEDVDQDGHLYIDFPGLQCVTCTRTWVFKEQRAQLRILRPRFTKY